jgi:hypothetical protein
MAYQDNIILLLNKSFGQFGRLRKDSEINYYCTNCSHPDLSKKKLEVELHSGKWHCWRCGIAGLSFYSLFKKFKISQSCIDELNKILSSSKLHNNHKKFFRGDDAFKTTLPAEFIPLSKQTTSSIEYRQAIHYVKKRGITDIDILRYNIGYCEDGKYKNRVLISSYDEDGNLNFFSARDYYNTSKFSYLLPDWSKNIIGNELYINWHMPVTLTEGQFDAIAIRNNAIPLFGKTVSNRLKEALIENKVELVNIVLDNDALKDSIKLYEELQCIGIENIKLVSIKGKDASEIGFDKIKNEINSAKITTFDDIIKLKVA